MAITRDELLAAITAILDAGGATGDLRTDVSPDVSTDDIAAGLIGIFTVAGGPEQHPQAERFLSLLMDGLRA